ncbi:bifunctional 4-hydroxy-2-oxoglutarate aldolase/2-dehydro-3-deoxy-phosphogluconate aldolase [Pseudohalioglobus lutimaris]|uniref:2-dehydro-3-deoxy-phosphogluconate aldolase n=1 Tax=Pseudohalioglobus lutimaris TaxID=1737061 RepID=A0A2N5X5G5_9GAMM|nr:bifunctional 4-hydroxy-2-oxoglutarate aldolase/2-dehydro-3-deoxy-phosphogluconate aldolase [Pseudohalioglobus lutimaris]PLW69729.1 keto-deoxy-phosphogluconate aldolase [Pseudohalioglobus lutimaris]
MSEVDLSPYRVLPVVTARDEESTVSLARALLAGGMRAIEITLRTSAALPAIAAVSEAVPEMQVAAGTVTNERELAQVVDLGVSLALSPGCTESLLAAASDAPLTFIPGVASASEVMRVRDYQMPVCKLFPATVVGGVAMLKALAGPFPDMQFCPTGGLNRDNFRAFLALPNVVCCGGSWMVSSDLVDNANWNEIEALAREAMAEN